jgi:hypothetical protein
VYPRARAVIEEHAAALGAQLGGAQLGGGQPHAALPPISDDFVPALRSDAGAGELALSAALPLMTTAAIIGELESTYPAGHPAAEQLKT